MEETHHNFSRFFELARRYSHIETLDRDTLLTFVERIEVGPKIFPDGITKATHRNTPYRQRVGVYYKFIGNLSENMLEHLAEMPKEA